MYKEYYGFTEAPFRITPNSRFFYQNARYREACAMLFSGIAERRGLMTLIGAVGTGKTTVLRYLEGQSGPGVRCIASEYPPSTFDELLAFVCGEMGLSNAETRGRLDRVNGLKKVLLERHAQNVITALLLDEAQQLTEETLEGIRLLSNLQTAGAKALQIVLAGQPELRTNLDQPSLVPLKQRIAFWCRLDALNYGEIASYIEYRLRVAGYRGPELFGPTAVEAIGFYSGGVPRLINVLCGDALLRAHRLSQRMVSSDIVVESARNLHIGPAFEFTPFRPTVPERPSPHAASAGAGPSQPDRSPMPSGGRVSNSPGSWKRYRRRVRHTGTRRRMWAAIGGSAIIIAGTGALALFRPDYSSMAWNHATARPATTPPAASHAARGNAMDPSGLTSGSRTSPATTHTASPTPPAVPSQDPQTSVVTTPSPSNPETSGALDSSQVRAWRAPDAARPPVAATTPTPTRRGPSPNRADGSPGLVQGGTRAQRPQPHAQATLQAAAPAVEPRAPAPSLEASEAGPITAPSVEIGQVSGGPSSAPSAQGDLTVPIPPVRPTSPDLGHPPGADPSAIIDWLVGAPKLE
jgi:type II secretory pathway predicted ATPase ExeA